MSVTIISNEDLNKLNKGEAVDLDFGPLGVTIASEKWVKRMESMGNIKEVMYMKNWNLFLDALSKIKWDENGEPIKCEENDIHLMSMRCSGVTPDDVEELLHQ